MKNFTPEEIKPSERTLGIIRQMAYTYRVAKVQSRNVPCGMN